MKFKLILFAGILTLASAISGATTPAGRDSSASPASVGSITDPGTMRLEGEKRFRANCGRCHAAPHKFPPRMMATIVRHMRVRATITDQDMHYILFYMTE